jgi:hypothetical protein
LFVVSNDGRIHSDASYPSVNLFCVVYQDLIVGGQLNSKYYDTALYLAKTALKYSAKVTTSLTYESKKFLLNRFKVKFCSAT